MAISFTPGQIVAQPDWEELARQHGGDKPAKTRPPTADELAAARAAARAAAPVGENEEPVPNDPRTHYIKYDTNPIYRAYMEDGSLVEYRAAPNGTDYEIVDYKPSPKFTQAQAKATANDPATQTPAQQNDAALIAQRQKNAALPADQDPRYETDEDRAKRADARIKEQGAAAAKADADAKAEAEKNKPQPGKPYQNAQGQWVVPSAAPDGTVTTKPLPPEAIPQQPSEAVSAPPNQKWITTRKGDTYETVLNPNWKLPSRIEKDQATGKYIEVTEDPDTGKPIVREVTSQTTIKPADLPVLQSKYGEIAQGLGQLAQDLNGRVARGEITPEERKTAFEAAHAQASTQVAEINSILENSKAIWSGQVAQRRDTLGETQSRRSFASDAAGRAIQTGMSIATSAGPGHGQAIAAGVEALMGMQQRYAQGMGGFRESPEVGLPPALEQARGMSIPGFGPNAGMPPSPPPPPSGANVDATNAAAMAGSRAAFGGLGIPPVPPAPAPPPSGISNATDAGGVPRAYSPASSTVGSGLPPGVAGMGASLGAADGYGGAPVAAGGAGVWNPDATVQGMLGDGSDPAWEEAVRRAAQAHAQQGYGR